MGVPKQKKKGKEGASLGLGSRKEQILLWGGSNNAALLLMVARCTFQLIKKLIKESKSLWSTFCNFHWPTIAHGPFT